MIGYFASPIYVDENYNYAYTLLNGFVGSAIGAMGEIYRRKPEMKLAINRSSNTILASILGWTTLYGLAPHMVKLVIDSELALNIKIPLAATAAAAATGLGSGIGALLPAAPQFLSGFWHPKKHQVSTVTTEKTPLLSSLQHN
jgi:hypothetical protein